MRIAVIGLGHIGLPLAVQYASRGHEVTGVDIDERIVATLNRGESPHADEQALVERVPRLVETGESARHDLGGSIGRSLRGGGRRDRAGRGRRAARDRVRANRRGHARPRGQRREGRAGGVRDDPPRWHDPRSVRTDPGRRQRPRARSGPLPRLQSGARPRRPRPARPPALSEDRRRDERGEHASRGRVLSVRRSTRGPRSGPWPMPRPRRWSSWPRRRTATSTSPTPTSSRALPRAEGWTSPRSSVRPTRSRTATSTSRASASAATASRSTPTSSSTASRTCGCLRWLATSTIPWPDSPSTRSRTASARSTASRCSCSASPTAET